ncbi:MAG: GNAT family N-acetyltransferase [Fibrobacter sp.]|jgi:predicted kinase/GNAT superfamily N-acetyltransferase|nr:GNAT family N-acetyltransferase [Fibrobacter sp.]
MLENPVLFIFSGLPASGKSTLAKLLAKEYRAVYLRIDTVEQGLRDLCGISVQGEGYRLSYRIASDNLNLGQNVVADSCNPITLTREEWQAVAENANARFINIEVRCDDPEEHQNRVETRTSEVPGLKLPVWQEIENREYHPWESERIVIETAGKFPEESFEELREKIKTALSMQIRKYAPSDFDAVSEIVHKTIETIYPKHYSPGAVAFFHAHHSKEKMQAEIPNEQVLVLLQNGKLIGSGAVFQNEIRRVFILPEFQGMGGGTLLLRALENAVGEKYALIRLDSTLGAAAFYRKNGYSLNSEHSLDLPGGDPLCYLDMSKKNPKHKG